MNQDDEPLWRADGKSWLCRRHIPGVRNLAEDERCAFGCKGITRPPRPDGFVRCTPGLVLDKWRGFADYDEKALRAQKIRDLRKYARHEVGIIGASKILGGKDVLIPLILARRVAAPKVETPKVETPKVVTPKVVTRRAKVETPKVVTRRAKVETPKVAAPEIEFCGDLHWSMYGAYDEALLYRQKIRDLRKYARHEVEIIGASKIPGGKAVLVPLILRNR